jgi:hypothetical protein
MGTHDEEITDNEIYNLMFRHLDSELDVHPGKFYYYLDRKNIKVRMIFLDTGIGSVSSTQVVWLLNLLKSTPDGYKVLVFGHFLFSNSGGVYTKTEFFTMLIEILGEFKNSGSYTYDNVVYDFSENSYDVIGVISGHVHADYSETTSYGFPLITTTCDAYADGGYDYTTQAFDVFSIDIDNRKIYATRFGTGSDRTFDF